MFGIINPSIGFQPPHWECRATARAAITQGEVVVFDLTNTDGDVSNNIVGDAASGFANVKKPAAGDIVKSAVYGLALEDIADNATGRILICGIAQGSLIRASGSIASGDALVPTTAGDLDGIIANGERQIAIALEAVTTPTTSTLGRVLFNGWCWQQGNA